MTEEEMVTAAWRAVRWYFRRREDQRAYMRRLGYETEWFVWPAFARGRRVGPDANPRHVVKAMLHGVHDEIRRISGIRGDRRTRRGDLLSRTLSGNGGRGGEDAPDVFAEVADPRPGPDAAASVRELGPGAWAAVSLLTPGDVRDMAIQHYARGEPMAEVAARWGLNLPGVSLKLARAIQDARQWAVMLGRTMEDYACN